MIKYIVGPAIGAVIGYFTNFIAVKMLFFPRKEVRVFGHRLPFTPGAIPKGKPRLAKAVGNIVGNTLLTKEDMKEKLAAHELGEEISMVVLSELNKPIKELVKELTNFSEEAYIEGRNQLATGISEQMIDAVSKIGIAGIIAEKGAEAVKSKVQGTMMAMFVSDDLIQSIVTPLGEEIQKMIEEQGMDYVQPVVKEKIEGLELEASSYLLGKMNITESMISNMIRSIFLKMMDSGVEKILDKINITEIVEEKINAMPVEELEDMVLTVMKKELNTIVNLGALIGLLLGLFNLVF